MPQLLLNEDSTLLCIEIKKYHPTKEIHDDWDWCDIHIKIKNSYIDFDETNEFLTNWEVEWISRYLRDIVEKGYESSEEESFTEPEINFSTEDGTLDIIIEFCSNGCYCGERWSTGLTEEETKEFYEQWLAEMQECAKEKPEFASVEEKTANHLTNKCGFEVTPNEVKDINDKITANSFVKNGVLNISLSSKTNVDKILNESEVFKAEMKKIKATGKNMCAFVSFYKNGGGKTYTYLVDAYYHGGRWFVEDTDKEVYVMEFGELTDDELPVTKDKMKHLRWEENDLVQVDTLKKGIIDDIKVHINNVENVYLIRANDIQFDYVQKDEKTLKEYSGIKEAYYIIVDIRECNIGDTVTIKIDNDAIEQWTSSDECYKADVYETENEMLSIAFFDYDDLDEEDQPYVIVKNGVELLKKTECIIAAVAYVDDKMPSYDNNHDMRTDLLTDLMVRKEKIDAISNEVKRNIKLYGSPSDFVLYKDKNNY